VQGGSLDTWAAQVSDRVLVLLNHSRRLVPEGRWQQAISCMTPHQVESLKVLREHFQAVCPVGDSCSSGSNGDFLASGAGGRSLKATRSDVSAVSVDSMGLPSLSFMQERRAFATPRNKASKSRCARDLSAAAAVAEAEALSPVPCTKEELKETMGCGKLTHPSLAGLETQIAVAEQPAVKKRPAAHAAGLQGPQKKPRFGTGTASPQGAAISKSFGRLFCTRAQKQSYLQYVPAGSSQKKLVVAVSASQADNHHALIEQLETFALGAHLDKVKVQQRRDALLAQAKGSF